MTVCIKRMESADVEFVKNLEIACNLSSWSKEDYLAEIVRNDSICLILKSNNLICGFIIARLITNNTPIETAIKTETEAEIEIYNIAIELSKRRGKFGSLLLNELLNQASALNPVDIYLEVRDSNLSAINFYKKNGFIETGRRKNFYSSPNEDAILMHREL